MPSTPSATPSRRLTIALRTLAALALFVTLLWWSLPALLGYGAAHWLSVPGLSNVRLDIQAMGTQGARLSELRADYEQPNGDRFRVALRGIELEYTAQTRHLERVNIARADLEIFPAKTRKDGPWPPFALPSLPLDGGRVEVLHLIVHGEPNALFETAGRLDLRQQAGRLSAVFTTERGQLRLGAEAEKVADSNADAEVMLQADWYASRARPGAVSANAQGGNEERDNRPDASLRLLARSPGGAAAPAGNSPGALQISAQLPLPLLAELSTALGTPLPLQQLQGRLTLKGSLTLGEQRGHLAAVDGEAGLFDASASVAGQPVSVDGKIAFAWQPSSARLTLQPGLYWQAHLPSAPPVAAEGRLAHPFSMQLNESGLLSQDRFPVVFKSPRWGQWLADIEALQLKRKTPAQAELRPENLLTDWTGLETEIRIKGQLPGWRSGDVALDGMTGDGRLTLHWAPSGTLRAKFDLAAGAKRLTLSGATPFSVARAEWTIKGEASARGDATFRETLTLSGDASSPTLVINGPATPSVTLGASRLHADKLRPFGRRGNGMPEGKLTLAVDAIRVDHWPLPELHAALDSNGAELHGTGHLAVQGNELVRFSARQRFSNACGDATVQGRHALPALDAMLKPRPAVLDPLAFSAGTADAQLDLTWCGGTAPRVNAKGVVRASGVALAWDQAHAQGVNATLRLDGLHPARGQIQLSAAQGELATGTTFDALDLDVALAGQSFTVHALDLGLLGGRVHAEPTTLPWPPLEETLPLQLNHIDLGRLLELFDVTGLSASGKIDGVMPLAYRDGGIEVDDAQLRSPGQGTLKYAPDTGGAALADNPGLQALRDFHFRKLGLHLWYGSDGAYRVQTSLEGNNPGFYDGYPIRFGLNINGQLPGIFRSAIFSGDFNRHILEQLQSGKLE